MNNLVLNNNINNNIEETSTIKTITNIFGRTVKAVATDVKSLFNNYPLSIIYTGSFVLINSVIVPYNTNKMAEYLPIDMFLIFSTVLLEYITNKIKYSHQTIKLEPQSLHDLLAGQNPQDIIEFITENQQIPVARAGRRVVIDIPKGIYQEIL